MSSRRRKILIASGVNLDLLGRREPSLYGGASLRDMENLLKKNIEQSQSLKSQFKLHFFQSPVRAI